MNISIILPTFNRPNMTIRALNSIVKQTYRHFELIVIDDGSFDNTYDRINDYLKTQQNIKYKLIKKTNKGVSHARNIGLRLAQYDWVAFLDSDDEWLPSRLQTQVNYINKTPDCHWVYSDEQWVKDGVVIPVKPNSCKKYHGAVLKKAIDRCFIGCSTVLIRKSHIEDVGGFNENFPACEDYDLWLKLLSKYKVDYIDQKLVTRFGGHDDQLSRAFHSMNLWRLKSVANLLEKSHLNEPERSYAENFIKSKAPQLMNGYKKYNNPEQLQEVADILNKLSI